MGPLLPLRIAVRVPPAPAETRFAPPKSQMDVLVGLLHYDNEVWLLVSWSLYPPSDDPELHLTRILRDEPDLLSHGALLWIPRSSRIHSTARKGGALYVVCEVNARAVRQLFDRVGDPESDGRWLASRLTPRRLPAAARVHPDHLQLWLAL